jgi:hypothetical protein
VASFVADLLDGLAEHIAEAGIATYLPRKLYAADDTAITVELMPDSPTRVLCLSAYMARDDMSLSTSVISVQTRIRAGRDPREVHDLSDAIFDLLHGAWSYKVGRVSVVQSRRSSSAVLGLDKNNRWEHSDNYEFTVWRPSPHRI